MLKYICGRGFLAAINNSGKPRGLLKIRILTYAGITSRLALPRHDTLEERLLGVRAVYVTLGAVCKYPISLLPLKMLSMNLQSEIPQETIQKRVPLPWREGMKGRGTWSHKAKSILRRAQDKKRRASIGGLFRCVTPTHTLPRPR